MFVEEGFRIRFANGETIDFYADSAADKEGWMKALAEVVGKDSSKPKAWTDLVLARQRANASKVEKEAKGAAAPARSAPPTPAKTERRRSYAPPPVEKDPRHEVIEQRRAAVQKKTKSMIF